MIAAGLTACGDDTGDGSSATLTTLAGTVEVAVGTADFLPADPNQQVTSGDTVRTGADGRAELVYFEGSITRLDFNTTFTVIAMERLRGGGRIVQARQERGNTYSRVAAMMDAGSRFDIETPTASAGVVGTEYALLIDDEGATTIVVIEDSVRVTAVAGETVVEAGFSVVVRRPEISSTADLIPFATPDETLTDAWIVFNQPEG